MLNITIHEYEYNIILSALRDRKNGEIPQHHTNEQYKMMAEKLIENLKYQMKKQTFEDYNE